MFGNFKQWLHCKVYKFINPDAEVRKYLLIAKFLIFAGGGALAGFNWTLDPANLVTVPLEDCPFHLQYTDGTCQISEFDIRVAGFTLITAIVLFAGVFPFTREQVDISEYVIEILVRLLGVAVAFGAGWFSLGAATFGNRGDYVEPMLGFVAFAAFVVVTGAWTGWFVKAILPYFLILTLVWTFLILAATVWCLWIVAKFIWERISHLFH